jgi:hypothetical protein
MTRDEELASNTENQDKSLNIYSASSTLLIFRPSAWYYSGAYLFINVEGVMGR